MNAYKLILLKTNANEINSFELQQSTQNFAKLNLVLPPKVFTGKLVDTIYLKPIFLKNWAIIIPENYSEDEMKSSIEYHISRYNEMESLTALVLTLKAVYLSLVSKVIERISFGKGTFYRSLMGSYLILLSPLFFLIRLHLGVKNNIENWFFAFLDFLNGEGKFKYFIVADFYELKLSHTDELEEALEGECVDLEA